VTSRNWESQTNRQPEAYYNQGQNQIVPVSYNGYNQTEAKPQFKDVGRQNMPPKNLSRNSLINGSRIYNKEMGILCIRCGGIGHRKPECAGPQLEWWEQSYLRDMIWPKINVNSASLAGAGAGLKYRDIQDSNWRKGLQ
ncbi:hypothetical protein GcC1_210053, partial [Golovinomyces cichoracearum]